MLTFTVESAELQLSEPVQLIPARFHPSAWPSRMQQVPFARVRQGAIKFDYGAQTFYAASSADEAEGRMIVEWLRPKLPRSTSDAGI